MPRRKRKLEDVDVLPDEIEDTIEIVKPLRRTRQRNIDEVKNNAELKPKTGRKEPVLKSKSMAKQPKVVLEKIQRRNEIHSTDFEQNSPDSTDSGIGSGPSIKEESFTELEVSAPIKSKKDLLKTEKLEVRSKSQRKSKTKGKLPETNDASKADEKLAFNKKISNSSKDLKVKQEHKDEEEINLMSTKNESKSFIRFQSDSPNSVDHDTACCSSTASETALQVLTRLEFDSTVDTKACCSKYKVLHNNDSSSDSDWEEVEENKEQSLEDYNPEIPEDGVQITIDCPELNHKRKKKQFDHMEYIRLYINRERKEHQLNVHKTHLLCLLAHGFYVNNLLNSSLLKAVVLSLIPQHLLSSTAGRKIDKINLSEIQSIVDWFCEFFEFANDKQPFVDIHKHLQEYFQNKLSLNTSEYNLMFIIVARALGFKTRLCVSFYPITYKAKNLLSKPGSKSSKGAKSSKNETDNKSDDLVKSSNSGEKAKKTENLASSRKKLEASSKLNSSKKENVKKSNTTNSSKNKKIKLDNTKERKKSNLRQSAGKSYNISSDDNKGNSEEDEDFIIERINQMNKFPKKSTKKQPNRKIISSDSSPSSPESYDLPLDKIVCWSEVFCKSEKHWISIECCENIINKPYDIEKLLPKPVTYIVGFDNDSYVKDLTRRYCNEYMTSTVKLRADPDWWEETLEPFSPPNSKLDKEEEKKLEETLVNKPLPQTISGFKNHPLYALKRHLLKFEAIYPPDAAPVGFLRSEPVYARENVCQLHSRETWLKEARVVRIGEEAYKIVKARPKWNRVTGIVKTDLPLEIFGFWQTEQYKPPVAVDGKVPRNEYGNVELFKPCMLPRGTVHLQAPGLNRVAKKLGIDCSPAVVGFDGHKGSIHPVFDGFVVCKEYKDTLLAAWDEEQENARKREEEKREKRIYGNWKKLIKGLLIREKIKLKYHSK